MAVRILDGAGNALTSTSAALDVNIKSSSGSQTIAGSVKLIDTAGANQASVSAAGAVKVDGSAVTQPVSVNFPATQAVAGTVSLGAGAAVIGHVIVDTAPTTPVTGTFFQATQPVSATSLPLPTGASTAAKQPALGVAGTPSSDVISVQGVAGGVAQPVSGTVAVSNFPASTEISNDVGNPIPVNGTVSVGNFPATQPVSLAVAPTTPVTGTFFQTTQPVSAAALPLPTGAATSANQSVPVTKGVQGATADPTQDLKDSGRVIKVLSASFTAVVAEALVTLTPITDGVAGATGTSFTVTTGKRFRVQSMFLTLFNITAAIHACQVNLRMSNTGTVTGSSPLVATCGVSTAAATANLSSSAQAIIPDGLEFSGTMQFGISNQGIALPGQTVTLVGYEY